MLLRMNTRMIQIRHVPEDVHRKLKERARREGMSLSDYLRRELELLSQQLTWQELFDEIDREGRTLDPLAGIDSAELIRQGREERDRELMGRMLGDDQDP
jgi:antitoxin FitA